MFEYEYLLTWRIGFDADNEPSENIYVLIPRYRKNDNILYISQGVRSLQASLDDVAPDTDSKLPIDRGADRKIRLVYRGAWKRKGSTILVSTHVRKTYNNCAGSGGSRAALRESDRPAMKNKSAKRSARPATWGIFTRRAGKLYKARSRLYRSQIFQVSTRWS